MKSTLLILFLAAALRVPLKAELPSVTRFEQRIGQQLPLDAVFSDETGSRRSLGAVLNGKPALVYFNYLRCPQLCSVVADGAVDVLTQLQQKAGTDFVVVSISIDPTDTPPMARIWKERQVLRYGRTGAAAGWHILTGGSANIRRVTDASGFNYRYDERSMQYAHPSGLIVVTPLGRVSRYFLGVDYPAPEVAASLRRAAENKTGEATFDLLLNCLEGGTAGGQYGKLIWTVLSISVVVTVVALFGSIAWMLRQELKPRKPTAA